MARLFPLLLLLTACGADNAKRAAGAIEVEQYRQELVACKEQGKDAGSYAVYEKCADGVDAKHGVKK